MGSKGRRASQRVKMLCGLRVLRGDGETDGHCHVITRLVMMGVMEKTDVRGSFAGRAVRRTGKKPVWFCGFLVPCLLLSMLCACKAIELNERCPPFFHCRV